MIEVELTEVAPIQRELIQPLALRIAATICAGAARPARFKKTCRTLLKPNAKHLE